jgi:YD repeat-containing protein
VATVNLSTSPSQIDDGSAGSLSIVNSGNVEVELARAQAATKPVIERLRPGQNTTLVPEGAAVTAVTVSGTGSISVAVTAKPQTPASTYPSLNPEPSTYTYDGSGRVATETVAGVATTYTYDSSDRVATSTRAGVTRTYTYDGNGNVTAVA